MKHPPEVQARLDALEEDNKRLRSAAIRAQLKSRGLHLDGDQEISEYRVHAAMKHEYLIRLATEAVSTGLRTEPEHLVEALRAAIRERMAQAAQVWTCDAEEAHMLRAENAALREAVRTALGLGGEPAGDES